MMSSSTNEKEISVDKKALAKLINNKLFNDDQIEKITSSNLMDLYVKIISEKVIKLSLLFYELENLDYDTKIRFTNNETFIKDIFLIFERYNPTFFETMLEDNEFTYHDSKSKRYPLKDNEFIFENTLHVGNKDDSDTLSYLSCTKSFIRRNIDKNISVRLIVTAWSQQLLLVIFKFTVTN